MLLVKSRGWMSSSDPGINTSYYLYIGVWYRTFSPNDFLSVSQAQVVGMGNDGCLGYNLVYGSGSGVQFY